MKRALVPLLVGVAIACAALVVALCVGSTSLGIANLWVGLTDGGQNTAWDIVLGLRLPRAVAAFASGALLALSGGMMQALLRNPLADPYVLGVAGGAAVGALGTMLIGAPPPLVPAGAGAGALASTAVLLGLARSGLSDDDSVPGSDTPARLVLLGVSLAIGWSALVTLILVVAPDPALRGMLFWLVGDLGGADGWLLPAVVLMVVSIAVFPFARDLTVLTHGSVEAQALGVRVAQLRWGIVIAASLATAAAVVTAGPIGFVGLIVPHALRLLIGNDQRLLLPMCVLVGGAWLVLADAVARTAFAPLQLPAGVVTAVAGVPVFVALLLTRRDRA